MNKFIFSIFLLFLSYNLCYGQFSIYEEKYNALKEIQQIPDSMTYYEFLKIQRNIDWSKIVISAVVPGFLHFYADKPVKAWIVATTRIIGYGFVTYAAIDQYKLLNSTEYSSSFGLTERQDRMYRNTAYFAVGALLNLTSFFYDWADATLIIESERNEVYFKYGLDEKQRKKLGISFNQTDKSLNINYEYKF